MKVKHQLTLCSWMYTLGFWLQKLIGLPDLFMFDQIFRLRKKNFLLPGDVGGYENKGNRH